MTKYDPKSIFYQIEQLVDMNLVCVSLSLSLSLSLSTRARPLILIMVHPESKLQRDPV